MNGLFYYFIFIKMKGPNKLLTTEKIFRAILKPVWIGLVMDYFVWTSEAVFFELCDMLMS